MNYLPLGYEGSITQGDYTKPIASGVGLAMSIFVYTLSKSKTIRTLAIIGGGWSALSLYESWPKKKEQKKKEEPKPLPGVDADPSPDPVTSAPTYLPKELKKDASMVAGVDATNREIAALERAINKLDLSGSTGLPDPDLEGM